MSGDWGKLDCPRCGHAQPPPDPHAARNDCDELSVDMRCANCGHEWEHRVEIWRYYGLEPGQATP